MISPGDTFKIYSIAGEDVYYLVAIEVARKKAGYDVWSMFPIGENIPKQFHHAEDYWLENQERVV